MTVNELNNIEELNCIIEKYKDFNSEDMASVNNTLDRILLDFNTSKSCPNMILTRALYEDTENKSFKKGKFAIRPTVHYDLKIKDMKTSFVIINGANFYTEFVESIINWVKCYRFYALLEGNLNKLNESIENIIEETTFPYKIKFSLGEGIKDISDDYVELGLNSDVILNIEGLALFSQNEYWRNKYIEKFINILKECNRPYDIIKIKSEITKELKIYNRKSIHKLLRQFVSRNINYVRVGVGYAENEDTFALIERLAIMPEQVKDFDLDEVILMDNENPTQVEKKKGLTKIITRYKLMPFEKKTNILVDMKIKDYLEILNKEENL